MVKCLKRMIILSAPHSDNIHKTASLVKTRLSSLLPFRWKTGKVVNAEASWPPKKPGSYFRTLRRLLNLLTRWGKKEEKGQKLDLGFLRL